MIVDMNDYRSEGGRVFAGRERGTNVRRSAGLDAMDKTGEIVEVKVPDDVYSITPSFFGALFGPSVRKLGSKESFLKKYRFTCEEYIREEIEVGIVDALKRHSPLEP